MMKKIGKLKARHSKDIHSSKISVGFESLDRGMFNPEPCYDKVGELGVKFARCQTGWCLCETEKGVYDFSWLDDVVNKLLTQGVQPWFNVGFGNKLYMPSVKHESAVGHVPLYYGQDAIDGWLNYLKALTEHFKDRIMHYEIWNEPNLINFWAPMPEGKNVAPEDYVELVKISSECIKSIKPDAILLACTSFVPLKYIRDTLKDGIGDYIDIYALHPYGAESSTNLIRDVRVLLNKYAPKVKLWQGERGLASASGGHEDINQKDYFNSEDNQAKGLLKRTIVDLTTEYELTSYFHIADFMEEPYRQSGGEVIKQPLFGLLNGLSYTSKKSYFAYQNICSIFDDKVIHEDLPFSVIYKDGEKEDKLINALIWTSTFHCNGYPMLAYFAKAMPEDKEFAGDVNLVTLSDEDKPIEEPILVDMLDGSVYELEFSEMVWWQEQIFPGDCFIEHLPLKDYPMIVTDRNAIQFEV